MLLFGNDQVTGTVKSQNIVDGASVLKLTDAWSFIAKPYRRTYCRVISKYAYTTLLNVSIRDDGTRSSAEMLCTTL